MKLPTYLYEVIKDQEINNVLEIGPCYPFLLIELLHKCNVFNCVSIEQTPLGSSLMISKLIDEIIETTNLSKYQIHDLIEDSDDKVTFYNSYKWYAILSLTYQPMSKAEIENRLTLHYSHQIHCIDSVKEKIQNQKFKLIIASKSISHIKPSGDETKLDIIFYLITLLYKSGYIYLRLNSTDISKDDYCFKEEEVEQIRKKMKVIYDEPYYDKDGRMHYEIIGTTISNM